MTRTLLITDPRCVLIDAETDTAEYDIFERLVIDAAGGWTGDAPVCRRGLNDWRERLLTLLGIVRADVVGVVSIAADYPAHASSAKVLAYIPAKPAVKSQLSVPFDTPDELAIGIDRVVAEKERIVIATGQRDHEYVNSLHSEVSWRTSVAPVIVNASRLGLLERDFNALADALGVEHPQKRV